MIDWRRRLNEDPLPWLLQDDAPAVKHLALSELLDRPADDPEVRRARRAAMRSDPIAATARAQHPDGYWVKPGAGHSPKYTAPRAPTSWRTRRL